MGNAVASPRRLKMSCGNAFHGVKCPHLYLFQGVERLQTWTVCGKRTSEFAHWSTLAVPKLDHSNFAPNERIGKNRFIFERKDEVALQQKQTMGTALTSGFQSLWSPCIWPTNFKFVPCVPPLSSCTQ